MRAALSQMNRETKVYLRFLVRIPVDIIGGEFIRSDPGEPPRRETYKENGSRLYFSFHSKVDRKATSLAESSLWTNDSKAPLLEEGTQRMEARPFWSKGLREARHNKTHLKELFQEHLERIRGEQSTDADDPADDSAYTEDF